MYPNLLDLLIINMLVWRAHRQLCMINVHRSILFCWKLMELLRVLPTQMSLDSSSYDFCKSHNSARVAGLEIRDSTITQWKPVLCFPQSNQ
uniref:Secreted protein n=1 Tax=Ixodes ricinus TaxID=34613 RepID=A0A6B0UCD3_IXORI